MASMFPDWTSLFPRPPRPSLADPERGKILKKKALHAWGCLRGVGSFKGLCAFFMGASGEDFINRRGYGDFDIGSYRPLLWFADRSMYRKYGSGLLLTSFKG